jgi:MYXO-CTERM domain-containing protein
VSGYSYSSAGCDGGTCTVEAAAGGSASASCDVAPGVPAASGGVLGFFGLGLLGAFGRNRRRRGSR